MNTDDEFVNVGDMSEDYSPVVSGSDGESTITEYRNNLVKKYHSGINSLRDKLFADPDLGSAEIIGILTQEIVGESDNLLANHLIATDNNALRDASVIQHKRADILGDIVKIIQTQKALEAQNALDVNSPSMAVVIRYFFSAVKDSMKEQKYDNESQDVLIKEIVEQMGDWRKELKKKLEAM